MMEDQINVNAKEFWPRRNAVILADIGVSDINTNAQNKRGISSYLTKRVEYVKFPESVGGLLESIWAWSRE